MLELFSSLISLVIELKNTIKSLKPSKEKKLARSIIQVHLVLQTIIDDAFMALGLIENANNKIEEYGSEKYTKIVIDNIRSQANRIEELRFILYNPEMSTIIKNLNKKSSKVIRHLLNRKSNAIYETLHRIYDSKLILDDGELYAVKGRRKFIAFPEIQEQLKLLKELEVNSNLLSGLIIGRIELRDLLKT